MQQGRFRREDMIHHAGAQPHGYMSTVIPRGVDWFCLAGMGRFWKAPKLGYVLPGKNTIPDQIAADKTPYYRALEAADDAWEQGKIDLTAMKELLGSMLAKQLYAIHAQSTFGEG
jgi:hypothetical protein